MATRKLESAALSAFCESVAIMLSAGIQIDEAVYLFGENMEDSALREVSESVYKSLTQGNSLAFAMNESGAFPRNVVDMVAVGERAGRLENVLRSLAGYYDEESRMFDKIRTSIGYPAALLCIMAVILAFTVAFILPVFVDVYESLSGSLTAGSFGAVSVSIGIGYVALAITLICALIALVGSMMSRREQGRETVLKLFEKLPFTRQAMYEMALSRFTSALSTFVASGIDEDTAMKEAMNTVDHRTLRNKLLPAYDQMVDLSQAKNLAQAIYDNDIYEPIYARMLVISTRSGSLDESLDSLSDVFFEDAVVQIDRAVDSIEPVLAAFLTVAVGATLIAVMLPLIGIMGSIG